MWRYAFWVLLAGIAVVSVLVIPSRAPDSLSAPAEAGSQALVATAR